jgi:hypothetical protein
VDCEVGNVKELSIPLKTWEVQAILDRRKTQMRLVIKPRDPWKSESDGSPAYVPALLENGEWGWLFDGCTYGVIGCSPYQPGDRLWVKETWGKDDNGEYVYRTNYGTTEDDSFPPSMFKWRPSIHMPKEAARIWLEVEDVRVERVQDITENDADWEGVGKCPYEHRVYGAYGYGHDSMCWAEGDCRNPNKACSKSVREHFREYWNSLYAKRGFGWDTNPWVWVIEFGVVHP